MTAPKWDLFRAVMVAEGADGYATDDRDEWLAAFQFLIDCGAVWTLRGFFGRTAHDLIEAGECHLPHVPDAPQLGKMRAHSNSVATFHKPAVAS